MITQIYLVRIISKYSDRWIAYVNDDRGLYGTGVTKEAALGHLFLDRSLNTSKVKIIYAS